MALPRIIYSDLSLITFGSTYAGTVPLTKLNNYLVNSYWQSTETGTQWLVLDMGSSVTVSDIVIDGHNWAGTTVTVIKSNDAGLVSGNTTIATFTPTVNYTPCQVTFSSAATSRYYGVQITGASVAPKVGNIFLGNAVVFTTPEDSAGKSGNVEYKISSHTSLDGTKRGSKSYKGRVVEELSFKYQNADLFNAFQLFTRTVCGTQFPFYYVNSDGVTRYMNLESDYVPISRVGYNMYNLDSLVMKTNQANN